MSQSGAKNPLLKKVEQNDSQGATGKKAFFFPYTTQLLYTTSTHPLTRTPPLPPPHPPT